MRSVTTMTKPSSLTPKRDLLPSAGRDHFTRWLDETYERGFHLGRAAGLEAACAILREYVPVTHDVQTILELLTAEKYKS